MKIEKNLISRVLKSGVVQLENSLKIKIYDDDYEHSASEVKSFLFTIRGSYEKLKHDFDVELQFTKNEMLRDYNTLNRKKLAK